jgi:hypothetical protein
MGNTPSGRKEIPELINSVKVPINIVNSVYRQNFAAVKLLEYPIIMINYFLGI